MNQTIQNYLTKVKEQLSRLKATEYSYRGALQELITAIIVDEKVTVVNEPKRAECGLTTNSISTRFPSKRGTSL